MIRLISRYTFFSFFNRSFNKRKLSLANFSVSFFNPSFSSKTFFTHSIRFLLDLNIFSISRMIAKDLLMYSSALSAVIASIRRTPAETELSDRILKKPICPVAGTCVPPHSSTDSPYLITRTRSPYFSPKIAKAPIACALAIGTLRCSSKGIFIRINRFTMAATSASSSSVTFWKCEKSNRKCSSLT